MECVPGSVKGDLKMLLLFQAQILYKPDTYFKTTATLSPMTMDCINNAPCRTSGSSG